ncbi:hypothetical protein ACFQ4M_16980 [Thauera mechernichensis]|uniref:Carrier domain-containing protein n=1 Tax=Thauera mechernichensis TaxID=82788 RepID=A0ABW3WHB8_9RHOO|nr:hypothetical protein [Thauera mechernichensis]MDG3066063.1 hypothetical protein [Thauera mechernichensis]
MSTRAKTLDVDAIDLKLATVCSVIDLVFTLDSTGDLDSLDRHSLCNALGMSMTLIGEARELLQAPFSGESA